MRARVYIGIGSNVEPRRNIQRAMGLLRARFGALTVSPVYASSAVGFQGADFLNLVVGFDTALSPSTLVESLRAIEAECGRRRSTELCSRSMDLDLLLYSDLVSREAGVPHSDILRYAFALKPLADIAADARHPVNGRSYAQLWAEFDAPSQVVTPVALEVDLDSASTLLNQPCA